MKTATAALRERGVLAGLRVERAAVKAQTEVVLSERSDGEILEQIMEFVLKEATVLGLDPEQCTVAECCSSGRRSTTRG
jgi:hypothetical protein